MQLYSSRLLVSMFVWSNLVLDCCWLYYLIKLCFWLLSARVCSLYGIYVCACGFEVGWSIRELQAGKTQDPDQRMKKRALNLGTDTERTYGPDQKLKRRTNVITSGSWVSEHTVVFLSWTLSLISPRRGRRLGHMCCPCSCEHCLCLGGICKGHVLLSVFICPWSAESTLWVCMFGWGWECLIPLEFIHSLSTGWKWKKGKWQPHI